MCKSLTREFRLNLDAHLLIETESHCKFVYLFLIVLYLEFYRHSAELCGIRLMNFMNITE